MDSTTVAFVTKDGLTVEVPLEVVNMLPAIKPMLEHGDGSSFIPIPALTAKTFKVILEYIDLIAKNPDDGADHDMKQWEKTFFERFDIIDRVEMVEGVDFLGIERGVKGVSRAIAMQLRGKSPQEAEEFLADCKRQREAAAAEPATAAAMETVQ